jgi:hypothetical protein
MASPYRAWVAEDVRQPNRGMIVPNDMMEKYWPKT